MISLVIKPNDSPYHGKDGDKFTYSQIKERLIKEAENDVSLRVEIDPKSKDSVQVFGRGDLHLGIILEKLRREGFEMTLFPPQVLFKFGEKGEKLEPIEELIIEFEEYFLDPLINIIQDRFGEIVNTTNLSDNRVKVILDIPTRGMFGLRTRLINLTKGHIVIQAKVKGYEPYKGPIKRSNKGAIISMVKGKCTSYALKDAESHGDLYVVPGNEVYEGQIIGELNKEGGEIELSPCREKVMTNVRTVMKDDNIKLQPVRTFTIEDCMVMLRGDEVLEVTPKYLRIRKTILDNGMRRKMKREKRINEDL